MIQEEPLITGSSHGIHLYPARPKVYSVNRFLLHEALLAYSEAEQGY